jgi:hypothetical protein
MVVRIFNSSWDAQLKDIRDQDGRADQKNSSKKKQKQAIPLAHIRHPAFTAFQGIHVPGRLTVQQFKNGTHPKPTQYVNRPKTIRMAPAPKKPLDHWVVEFQCSSQPISKITRPMTQARAKVIARRRKILVMRSLHPLAFGEKDH